jgi:hypothetical protein
VAAPAVANAPGWLEKQRGTPLGAHIELLKRYLLSPQRMQGDYDRTDLLWTASEYPGLLDADRRSPRPRETILRYMSSHRPDWRRKQ